MKKVIIQMKKPTNSKKRKWGLNPCMFMTVFLLLLSVLFRLLVAVSHPPSDESADDKLLGGLIPTGFEAKSCVSRYELPLYWRGVARKPSPHLISKLRSYEALHRRCGPHTNSYNKTLQLLQSGSSISNSSAFDCTYIVWTSFNGLGNKMLSLASTFLYALLTQRVLLVDRDSSIPDLFCEPFPDTSWFLPSDFPFTTHFTSFNEQSNFSYGNQLRTNSAALQSYMYLFLSNDCDEQDKLFFCEQHQTLLHSIPWLIMKTDTYMAPMFFLMPSFQQELHALFPEKETVFHLLGRYLFRPTNSVWELITRFYEAYLSKADVIAGIQIRLFDEAPPFKDEQILSCTKSQNILPQLSDRPINRAITSTTTTVAVVMVSLRSSYFERVREVYWENATETGEVVGVFQPSHEEYQQTGKASHDRKALAEIYLLSLTDKDKLVTSGCSTFGYVAQALGGVVPWILRRSKNQTVPDPPCGRGISLEPCYHNPPRLDCKTRTKMDMGSVVPHVRRCEDVIWGLKLF